MKSKDEIDELCGTVLVILSVFLGIVSAWMLSGLGICSFDLTGGMTLFALGAAIVMPVVTIRFLAAPWFVPPVAFCLLFPLVMLGAAMDKEWSRLLAEGGCLLVAFVGSWVFRPRQRRRNFRKH